MSNNTSRLTGIDRVYHALGRFVISFSHFQSTLELMVVHWLCPSGKKPDQQRAWAVISEQTIQSVSDSLFALCAEVKQGVWTKADFEIIRSIRKEINSLISKRNRIAHDIWSLGHPNRPLPDNSDVERVRFGRTPAKGAVVTGTPVKIEDVETLIETTERLRAVVREVGLMGLSDVAEAPSRKFQVGSDNKVYVK